MKRSSKLMLSGLGLFLLAVAIVPPQSQSSGGGPTVVVGNTPLPVQGTVAGTVAVSNFPGNQAVSGTVNVGNFPTTQAVSFNNASTSPMYVRDVDNAAHNRVQSNTSCSVPGDGTTDQCSIRIAVPVGSELVIETVSIQPGFNPGEEGSVQMDIYSGAFDAYLPLSFTYSLRGIDDYAATQPLGVYPDPGSTITFTGFGCDATKRHQCAIELKRSTPRR